jgi:hypothetical protein
MERKHCERVVNSCKGGTSEILRKAEVKIDAQETHC